MICITQPIELGYQHFFEFLFNMVFYYNKLLITFLLDRKFLEDKMLPGRENTWNDISFSSLSLRTVVDNEVGLSVGLQNLRGIQKF